MFFAGMPESALRSISPSIAKDLIRSSGFIIWLIAANLIKMDYN